MDEELAAPPVADHPSRRAKRRAPQDDGTWIELTGIRL
jgi:hypothetical protein